MTEITSDEDHSLRSTTATRGLTKGVPEKFVMERTGHRDVRALQRYEGPDIKTKVAVSKSISKCLDGGVSWFNKETHSIDGKAGNIDCREKRIRSYIANNTVNDDMASEEMESNRKRARIELQEKGYFNNCTFKVVQY